MVGKALANGMAGRRFGGEGPMLTSYFKIAWRHLMREKIVSLISVMSLSLGTACALLVFLFLQHEWVRDDFHVNGDRLFYLYSTNETGEGDWDRYGLLPMDAGKLIEAALPQVEGVTRWRMAEGSRLGHGDLWTKSRIAYVDSSFFTMLSFGVMHGDPRPLRTPNEVVLTASLAKRFTSDGDVASLVGKRFRYVTAYDNTTHEMVVSAILYDPTYRSTLQFEAFAHCEMLAADKQQPVEDSAYLVMLGDGAQKEAVEEGLSGLVDELLADEIARLRGAGKWSEPEPPFGIGLQPFVDAHEDPIPYTPVWVMPDDLINLVLILGSVVLLLGCVNFVVLSLGRSVYRSREIGLRKVTGARPLHVLGQIVLESIVLCALALLAGLLIADYTMPGLSSLFPMPNYALGWTSNPAFWIFVLLLPVAVGLLAGLYPAAILSRAEPVGALKGEVSTREGRLTLALIVLQFGLTVFVLATTRIVLSQFDYLRAFDRGFDTERIMTIDPNSSEHAKLHRQFRARVIDMPGVENVAGSSVALGIWALRYTSRDPDVSMFHVAVTSEFVETFGLTLLEGRDFRPGGPTDVVLVNEKMVKRMGWENPIGQTVPIVDGDQVDHPQVIGVVEDFHFSAPNWSIGPLVLHRNPETRTARVVIRMEPYAVPKLVPELRRIWKEVAPDLPSLIMVLSERFASENQGAERLFQSLGYSASLFGLLISCLGLFGVAMLTLGQRTKEVGIRKVLGASISSLFVVLSSRLVLS